MDVRGNRNPVLVSARRWLAGANARNPWNHNEHFHRWILRNLPARRRAAMDVGCGTGMLAGRLAPQFAGVIGIDADVNVSQTYDCFSAAASFALCDVRIDRLGPVHDGRCGDVQAVLGEREHALDQAERFRRCLPGPVEDAAFVRELPAGDVSNVDARPTTCRC